MASPIWKAFDLVNNGRLRDALETDSVPKETIDALIGIVMREEYRLNSLRRKRKK